AQEGFGIVFLEAMTAGLPIVACRAAAVPEVVADGVTGVLVPVRDPDALAAALARVLTDHSLAASLGAAGPGPVGAVGPAPPPPRGRPAGPARGRARYRPPPLLLLRRAPLLGGRLAGRGERADVREAGDPSRPQLHHRRHGPRTDR